MPDFWDQFPVHASDGISPYWGGSIEPVPHNTGVTGGMFQPAPVGTQPYAPLPYAPLTNKQRQRIVDQWTGGVAGNAPPHFQQDANGQWQPTWPGNNINDPKVPLPYGSGGADFGMTPTYSGGNPGGPIDFNDPTPIMSSPESPEKYATVGERNRALYGPGSPLGGKNGITSTGPSSWEMYPTSGNPVGQFSGTIGGGSGQPQVPWSLQNGLGPNAIQRAQAILAQHPSGIWGGVANKLLGMAQSGQLQHLATPQGQLAAMESKFQQHPNDFWSHLSTGMLGLAGQFGGNGGMNAGNGGQSAYPTTAQPAYQPVPADLSNPQNRSSY